MRKFYFLLLAVLFAVVTNAQVSVTATAGTLGPTPYTNLSSAFTAINAGTHQGAITIDITASFTDAATAVLNSNGAAPAVYTSVLIRPVADGLTISYPSVTGRGVIELNGADNVTIDGDNPNTGGTNRNLTITNTAANTITFTSVIRLATSTLITTCDNITVKNCNVNGSGTGRNTSAFNAAEVASWGIVGSGGASTVAATTAPSALTSAATTIASGQTALNFTVTNNAINTCSRGIALNGAATTVCPVLTVTNNIIGNPTAGAVDQVYVYGMTVQGFSTGSVIAGNTIYVESFVGVTPSAVIGIDVGIISANGTNAIIERNIIARVKTSHTGTYGAYGISLASSTASTNITVRNNFIYNVIHDMTGGVAFSTTFGVYGIRIATGTNNKIYHNSVSLSGPQSGVANSSLLTAAFALISTASTGTDVRNNIFSNTITGGTTSIAHVSVYLPLTGTAAMNLTWNNNAYYTGTTAGVHGIAHVGATYTATPVGPATYAGLYTVANFNPGAITPNANLRAYTNILSASGTNDNASYAFSTAAPFTSATNLHIPNGTATPLESSGAAAGVTNDIDGEIRNASTPDIGADEFTGVFVDVLPPAISYTALTAACSSGNRALNGVTITDFSGVPTAGALRPRIYYKKNSGSYFSQPGTLSGGTATNGTWDFTIVAADMGGVGLGDLISYYIIAQDIATPANIGSNPPGVVATDVNTITTHPLAPNTYGVGAPLNGTYTVGVGGNFSTLTNAVAAYNAGCGITGPVVFNLIDATYPSEVFPITINQNPAASAVNTLTIKPATTSTISGSVANSALIRILGNYVTIDGSNNGGTSRDLTITNTTITGPSVLLIGSTGAIPVTNSGLKNTIIINGANSASAVVVSDGATLGGAGNFNNITIQNNSVQRAFIGIYSIANVVAGNGSGLLITGNDLSTAGANSIRLACIYVQGVDGATVSNNTLGNVANTLDASNQTGIWFATGTVNSTISGNTISGFSGTLTAPRGIAISSAVAAANVNLTNNTITGLTSSTTQVTSGIFVFSTTGGVTVQNNKIRDIKNTTATGAYGINLASTTTGNNISVINNFVSDVASLGSATSTANGIGIVVSAGSGYSIYYNTVHLNTDQTAATGIPAAINITSGVTAAGAVNIRNNIFANTQTVGTDRYAIYSGAVNTVFAAIDYNDYFTTGPNLGFIGSNRANLAAIQAGFGGNTNSVNIAPVFLTNTDLHLNPGFNNTLNNLGTPIASITTDIDGNTRNAATPDMGADEFTPCTPPSSATASSNSPVCAGATLNLAGATNGTTYAWTGPNGFSSALLSPSIPNVTTAAAGIYTFQSFLAGCPSLVATTTATINPSPTITSIGASSPTICVGSSVNLTSAATSNLSAVTLLSEGFEAAASIPAGWASINGGTGNLWVVPQVNGTARTGARAAEYNWNTTQNANAYLITPGQNLTAGVTYTVSSWYRNSGTTFPERLKVTVGTAQTVAAQTTVIQDLGTITNATYAQQSATFTPAVSGTYYFAWNCYSLPDEFYVDVDDILITAPAPPPTFAWTSIPAGFTSSLQNPTGVSPTVTTTYVLTATNGVSGCSSSSNVIVTVGTPNATGVLVQPTTCVSTNGSITLTVSGGTGGVGPYSYAWTGTGVNPTSQNQSNLTTGTYNVVVTDVPSGCTRTVSFTLIGPGGCSVCPTVPTLVTNPTPAVCINSNTTLTASALTNMGVTYGITFKYSPTALADPYTGGTTIATVANGALTGGGTQAATTTTFPTAGNYIVYAVLSPTPLDIGCRPFAQANLTVNPTPTVNAVTNQTVCNGASSAAITFSGAVAGTVYNWTNNTTSIGLGASGSGNIASFTATNTGVTPVTATITVTPSFTNGGATCTGTPTTFTIIVNPTPTVAATANQTLCNGSSTTAVNFTGAVAGTVFNWTNNTASIGLAASGSGNIASFVATNAGAAPVTATITVTPSYTNGGTTCTGTPSTFTITVNPTPTVNAVTSQTVCNAASTTAITFSGAVTGTVYNWTNNTTSIGLGASGSGNIASFVAANTGTAAVTATITVTPSYTNGGATCTGTPVTFTITVNPRPTVNAVTNLSVCAGSSTAAITFGGAVTGTVFNWTNNTTSIGLAASGSGNIASFVAVNAGATAVVATITVTPSYTNGGTTCTGTPVVFTITVNPPPVVTVTALSNRICLSDTLIPLSGLPVGGNWSGIGVSGFNFVPPSTAVGSYTLTYTYTSAVGCTASATTVAKVENCVERERLLDDNAVIIYPNPNNGRFNIKINSSLYNYLGMKVYNMYGQLVTGNIINGVLTSTVFNGLVFGRVIPVDLSHLPAGTYIVKIYYDDGVMTAEKGFKVVIVH